MTERGESVTNNSSKYMICYLERAICLTCLSLEFGNQSNQFYIEDALDDDNSVVRLSSQTMDTLELFCGDTIKLKGKQRRETICIVLSDDECHHNRIRVNRVVQNNLRVQPGSIISIEACSDVKYGSSINVLPIDDTVKDFKGNLLRDVLQPYFLDAYRPVRIGDIFTVQAKTHSIQFKVIETDPSPYCMVAPETIVRCEGEPIARVSEDFTISDVNFNDVGGLENIKQELKDIIQLKIENREYYRKFGIAPSCGVLLYGPPGCGTFYFHYN